MTAAVLDRRRTLTGLRRADARRDMAGIADVVSIAFAGQLDPAGQHMLNEMRLFGRAGTLGWLAARLLLSSGATPDGFVWIEDGRLVGNVSLLSVEGQPRRWVIANVAVHPDFRRRGIGRSMVQAAIDLAGERQAETVVLQVDRANQPARALYLSMGFRLTSTRTTWLRPAGQDRPRRVPMEGIVARAPDEWRDQWALACRLHPEGFWWPYPPEVRIFRPGGVPSALGLDWSRHWLWKPGGTIQASLTAQARVTGGWRLMLFAEPECQGNVELGLLSFGLRELPAGSSATLEYAAGVAEPALWELGFRPERSLTWMAFDMPGDGTKG